MEKRVRYYPIAFVFIILMTALTYAQPPGLTEFNHARNSINKIAMTTLGSWALANIALSSALYPNSQGNRKYFYQMNAAWNVINLAIAGFGLYGAMHADPGLTLYQSMREQAKIENILLFNAGLDVAYVMTGVYLMEKARHSSQNKQRLHGYGQALIVQGSFLFLFDWAVFYFHSQNHVLAAKFLSLVQPTPAGIGLALHF